MLEAILFSRPRQRRLLLVVMTLSIAAIATIDWWHPAFISIGILYIFPLTLAGALLGRGAIFVLAILCAGLQEAFGDLPRHEAVVRFLLATTAFSGLGLLVWESARHRVLTASHTKELEAQVQLRRNTEAQLRAVVDSSPAAIVTIDRTGRIVLANQAAQHLFAGEGERLVGKPIADYMPALQAAVEAAPTRSFRTSLQGRAVRRGGEIFFAAAWFATYPAADDQMLSAIIVDLSEELRSREDISFDHLLSHAKLVMDSLAHEIRNISSAIVVAHTNLSRIDSLLGNDDFVALGTLVAALEKLTTQELRPIGEDPPESLDLASVLDELRVVSEPRLTERGIDCRWRIDGRLPMVLGERLALMQVFLNLMRNSEHALETCADRHLVVSASSEDTRVAIRFEDTGPGVEEPQRLFEPAWRTDGQSGIGLFLSRAIMRSFGGDLIYETPEHGARFAAVLRAVSGAETQSHA